ncbi:Uncharacterized protein DAT39_016933 [Clarias magur]|uniref:Uncharacterized protein n=1 Tax=Clarias magur TaxID=1594786 RepID=A0A8J4XBY9_CLAMG|nr:Uncharacterized protein DAT39_016933 [Clarias magur]
MTASLQRLPSTTTANRGGGGKEQKRKTELNENVSTAFSRRSRQREVLHILKNETSPRESRECQKQPPETELEFGISGNPDHKVT